MSGPGPTRPGSRPVGGSTQPRGPGMRGPAAIEKPRDARRALRSLSRFVVREWPLLTLVGIGIVAGSAARAIGPGMIGTAIDSFVASGTQRDAYIRAMVTVLLIYTAGWIAEAGSGALGVVAGNRIVFSMRSEVFRHLQQLDTAWFGRDRAGETISRITNDIDVVYNALTGGATQILGGLINLVAIGAAMLITSPVLALATFAALPPVVLITRLIGRSIRSSFRERQKAAGRFTGHMEESISAARTLVTLNQVEARVAEFADLAAEVRRASDTADIRGFALNPVMRAINGLTLAAVILAGGLLIRAGAGGVTVGVVSAFMLYTRRFFEPLRQTANVYNLIQSALAGAERLADVLAVEPGMEAEEGDDPGILRGSVEFRDLRFSYQDGQPVLDGVSLSVSEGETIAVVGPTGAGKTTLVALLNRLYDPDGGSILVDGRDIRELDLRRFRQQLGVVLQEPFLFTGSVRENLRYGRLSATDAEVEAAARAAHADAVIRALPAGYDTELTERGANLAQGERQLLAIARAVLANPRILILDEATSGVDSLTEARLQRGLHALLAGRTSFVIAHRLSTVRTADRVVVINDHRIAEVGTHDSLLAAGGVYSRLYRMQQGRAETVTVSEFQNSIAPEGEPGP